MQSFEELYSEYFTDIYKFVLSLCKDPTLAEELTQETFFKALKNIDSFKGTCRLSTWLCQIAKNTFYTHAKKRSRSVDAPLELIISDEDIETKFTDQETALAIHKILHNLTEPYKEIFLLRTFGELSFAQIGVLFGKTESWARVTYYRAKLKIKEDLQ